VLKNFPFSLLVRNAPRIAWERVNQTGRLLSAARAEFGLVRALAALAGAWLSAVWAIPHCLVERWRIQRSRAISVQELSRMLNASDEL
ncbi:MAG: hypothetical protein WC655_26785, partial [Candidatus Hydrogenedentales bacterium]|jgi:hypothetical protein